ncbi:polysaccharide pyruvyl transferase family protein [Mesorhizobium marinum]|uniref:polysaccharide pyruvyl transferase family protein n=1 Tax=Mesorhizobium marinum TaxID=3228790 RepID=UPI0034660AFA
MPDDDRQIDYLDSGVKCGTPMAPDDHEVSHMFGDRIAVIRALTPNIGDDMQTVAAARYVPKPAMLDRDRLDRVWRLSGKYRTIMNGWYMYRPESWPPSRAIDPLLVSMHLSNRVGRLSKQDLRTREHLLSGDNLAYFKHHAAKRAIGARDLSTLEALQKAGVEAYFSGCLTLTLQPRNLPRSDAVLAVDVAPEALAQIEKKSGVPIATLTHKIKTGMALGGRLRLIDELLASYETARVVVTSRLHVALPCLALGTPVFFVHKNLDDPRFGGLINLVHAAPVTDVAAGRFDYDLNAPPANADDWKPIAQKLRQTVEAFVGH